MIQIFKYFLGPGFASSPLSYSKSLIFFYWGSRGEADIVKLFRAFNWGDVKRNKVVGWVIHFYAGSLGLVEI